MAYILRCLRCVGRASPTAAVVTFVLLLSAAPASALVVDNVPLDAPPRGLAVDPTTHDVYVAHSVGRLSVISGDSHTVTGTINVAAGASAVGVDSSTHTAYVAHLQEPLSVVNERTEKVTATIPVGVASWAVAVDAPHHAVYVTNAASQTVSVINTSTNTVSATIHTTAFPFGVAVDPITRKVYVADGAPGAVLVIDGATNQITGTIPMGANSGPQDCAVDPATHTVYVVNSTAGTVSSIDEATDQVTGTIHVGKAPEGVTVDRTTNTVYVTNHGSHTLSIINGSTKTVTSTVPVEQAPVGVAVDPAESTAYVANTDSKSVSIVSPAEAPTPAIGVPIDTISGPRGDIRIGNKTYGSGALRLVVVNRKTLEVRAFPFPNNAAGITELRNKINSFDDDWLDIVTAPDGLEYGTDPKHINAAVEAIGGGPLPEVVAGGGIPLSVIGVRGWKAGTAYENPGGAVGLGPMRAWVCSRTKHSRKPPRSCARRGAVSSYGALIGYLQRNPATQAVGFTFGDFPSFDTRATSSADSVTIAVAGRRFSLSLKPGQSGFAVVYFDRWSLRAHEGVYATNTGNPLHDEDEQAALGQFLQRTSDLDLVVLQSIGTPKPTTTGWNEIAAGVAKVGGTRSLVDSLDGKGGYALVAVPGVHGDVAESVNDSITQQDGSLSGILARDHTAGFAPLLSDPAGHESFANLLQLSYEQPSSWPDRNSVGRRAAIRYISQKLELGVDDPRLAYTDLTINFDAAPYYGVLKDMTYPGGSATFSVEDFDAVKSELLKEFIWVAKVRAYTGGLRQVMLEGALVKQGELVKIANTIKDKSGAGGKLTSVDTFGIYSDMFSLAKAFAPDPEFGAVMGAVSTAFKIAGVLTKDNETDVLGRFTTTTDNLAIDLTQRFQEGLASLDVMQSILVTDHGKLETAGNNIIRRERGWQWTTQAQAAALRGMKIAATRLFNESLLRTVYVTYVLDPDFQNAAECRVLRGEPDSAWISHINSFTGSAGNVRPVRQAWAIGTRQEDDRSGRMKANADLTNPLFQKISVDTTEPLGLSKLTFISETLERQGLRVRYCHQLVRR